MQFDDIDGVIHTFSRYDDGGLEVFEVIEDNQKLVGSIRVFIKDVIVASHTSGDLTKLLNGLELKTEILSESNFDSNQMEVEYNELPNGGSILYKCLTPEIRDRLYLWFNFLYFSDLKNPIRSSLLSGFSKKSEIYPKDINEIYFRSESEVISRGKKMLLEDVSDFLNVNIKVSPNNLIFIPLTSKAAAHSAIKSVNKAFEDKFSLLEEELFFFSLTNSVDIIGSKDLVDQLGLISKEFNETLPWSLEISGAEAKGLNNYLVVGMDTVTFKRS